MSASQWRIDLAQHIRPITNTAICCMAMFGLEQVSKTLDRIRQICNDPIMEAHTILNELIEDVFDLADKFGYDTSKARQRYAPVRHANETEISLKKERRL